MIASGIGITVVGYVLGVFFVSYGGLSYCIARCGFNILAVESRELRSELIFFAKYFGKTIL